MLRDPATGFEYPFYYVVADVWNAKKEEYDRETICAKQTCEEAMSMIRKAHVNNDVLQVEVIEEYQESCETVAIKVAVHDDPSGYYFYDPRTDKELT